MLSGAVPSEVVYGDASGTSVLLNLALEVFPSKMHASISGISYTARFYAPAFHAK
jgi:hypothetical protein